MFKRQSVHSPHGHRAVAASGVPDPMDLFLPSLAPSLAYMYPAAARARSPLRSLPRLRVLLARPPAVRPM